jgi:hypothetical protein
VLGIWTERQPVGHQHRKGEKLLDEWRVLRLDAKVSCRKIGIACRYMHSFINGLRVGLDEENSLREESD